MSTGRSTFLSIAGAQPDPVPVRVACRVTPLRTDSVVAFPAWYDRTVPRESRNSSTFCSVRPDPALRCPRRGTYAHGERCDESGRHCMDARLDGARSADDAGPRVFLRRPRPIEERAEYDHDEL